MSIRIKLLTAAAAIALPAAMAAAQVTPQPAAATTAPVPAAATPPVADEASQQAQSSTNAAIQTHETAERVADAVEADAIADTHVQAQAQTMAPPAASPTPAQAPVQATAEAQATPAGPVSAATQGDLTAGAMVHDQAGGMVGTIETVDATGAVISTGTVRAKLPLASFGRNTHGLVVSMTKAQIEAAVAAQTPAPAPGS